MLDRNAVYNADCLEGMALLDDQSVQSCITSPPYWGLRDYGTEGQIGLEPTIGEYVEKMVQLFREVRRVLRDDGTLWLNLGDSYTSTGRSSRKESPGVGATQTMKAPGRDVVWASGGGSNFSWSLPGGQKPKDLCGIPWRVAFALQADGWYLRSDIIWHKPNPMPESVTDRPTKAHEYIFLLSKSAKYYYDAEAIKEPCSESTHARISQNLAAQVGSHRANGGGKTNGPMKAVIAGSTRKMAEAGSGVKNNKSFEAATVLKVENRNKRSVWTVATQPFSEAHFAVYPEKLITPCVLAGCPKGGLILDPFDGAGTTRVVAAEYGRDCISFELNPEYISISDKRYYDRTRQTQLPFG